MKKFIAFLCLLSLVLTFSGCGKSPGLPQEAASSEELEIYTSFYPIYFFSREIAGDKAKVHSIVPAGVEPHDFEPSMKQVASLYDAEAFFFLGESMEPWAKKIREDLSQKGALVLELGEGMIEDEDPHIWLDPILAKEMAYKIYEALVQLDGENRSYYEENYGSLAQELDKLHQGLKSAIEQSPRREVVTSHATFGYLAKRYGLHPIAVAGLSPQEEPSLKKMAELAKLVKELGIKYIFAESLGSNKLSETLAQEVGVSTLEFNPLESLTQDELDAGEDYFSVMWKNVEVLKQALAE